MKQNLCGLVSISFRNQTPEALIGAVKYAGLDAVEWGGDIHVPHGDMIRAKQVKALCKDIALPEYGSYYIIGKSDPALFEQALAVSHSLDTPMIRVWAGGQSSDRFSNEEYTAAVTDAARICALAPEKEICLECHPNTLTDEYHTALQFIKDVSCANLKLFFQPNQFRPHAYNMHAIEALFPYLTSVHVFTWKRNQKFPLKDGEKEWKDYLSLLKAAPRAYMLEFMHDNRLESLKETAETLKEWIK